MLLALSFRMLFIVVAIMLITVAFVVYTRSYHLKGQLLAFGVLMLFGIAYLFEVLRYMMPIEYSYFIRYWLVDGIIIGALCLTAHYIHHVVKRHSLLKTSELTLTPL